MAHVFYYQEYLGQGCNHQQIMHVRPYKTRLARQICFNPEHIWVCTTGILLCAALMSWAEELLTCMAQVGIVASAAGDRPGTGTAL